MRFFLFSAAVAIAVVVVVVASMRTRFPFGFLGVFLLFGHCYLGCDGMSAKTTRHNTKLIDLCG